MTKNDQNDPDQQFFEGCTHDLDKNRRGNCLVCLYSSYGHDYVKKTTYNADAHSFDHSTHAYTIFSLEAALIQKSQDKHRHVYAVAKGITNKLWLGEQLCFCFCFLFCFKIFIIARYANNITKKCTLFANLVLKTCTLLLKQFDKLIMLYY